MYKRQVLGSVRTPEAAEAAPYGGASSGGDFFERDKELRAIFEKTYGEIKRREFLPQEYAEKRERERAALAAKKSEGPAEDSVKEYLLVDGYNIIFAWDELKLLARQNLDAARRLLMDILSNYQGFRQCQVILVFDAYKVPHGTGEISRYEKIYVVYTREAETADAYKMCIRDRGYEEDDLFQVGVIGLIKAIDRFDTTYEVRFSTYAVPMIIGEIKRFLRDDGPLKVSRTYKDNLIQIRRAQEKLRDCLGREPTLGELEAEVGLPKEILTASLEAGCSPFSIDEAVYGDDGSPLYRVDQLKSPQNEEEDSVKRLALEEMLEKLEPREREIIRLRFFEDKTQAQVADRIGLSQVQISRLERAIIKKCRQMLDG